MSYRTDSVSFFRKKCFCGKLTGKTKKAGRIPVRENVGSAKNLLPERQRNAQQDTKTQWSLLVFRCLGAKELILKLGGFTFSFAEITDGMSSETGFCTSGIRFRKTIYTLLGENQAFSSLFSVILCLWREERTLSRHASLGARIREPR